eukprot:TRINITY_DN22217_c0_g2_i2.p1 TRINITY_DN22217_c0_g2~~TRINITY_DN22217_c0_g2_i2.p1  ORF type:complete len:423 (-),score=75.54 TRINITY_DN22217_c0_g2_i2:95-1363(-)
MAEVYADDCRFKVSKLSSHPSASKQLSYRLRTSLTRTAAVAAVAATATLTANVASTSVGCLVRQAAWPSTATLRGARHPDAHRRLQHRASSASAFSSASSSASASAIGRSKVARPAEPRCKFGIIGDIQYADCEDGSDFSGNQKRYFRNTLHLLRQAVKGWTDDGVSFIVQVGDAIDGRNADDSDPTRSAEAMATVLQEFPADVPRIDLIGNHELYNYPREELHASGLQLLAEEVPGAAAGDAAAAKTREACYCHFPADGEAGRWEIICLDAYDVSVVGLPEGHPRRQEATEILEIHNPRALESGVDWFQDLPQEKHRFVPYNGALSAEQLEWLEERLRVCHEADRKAIIVSHIPLLEESAQAKTVVWNAEAVLKILRSYEGKCVAAVFAGHDHNSGFAVDRVSGIPHLTMLSPLICPPGPR